MASGEKHARATLVLVVPAAVVTAYFTKDVGLGLAAGVGCLIGLFVEPDLDVNGLTRSEWTLLRSVWPVGILWVVLWYPYGLAVPHRSPLSHRPLIGTLCRLTYLGAFLIIGIIIVGEGEILPVILRSIPADTVVALLGGLTASDTLHWLMDGCP